MLLRLRGSDTDYGFFRGHSLLMALCLCQLASLFLEVLVFFCCASKLCLRQLKKLRYLPIGNKEGSATIVVFAILSLRMFVCHILRLVR